MNPRILTSEREGRIASGPPLARFYSVESGVPVRARWRVSLSTNWINLSIADTARMSLS